MKYFLCRVILCLLILGLYSCKNKDSNDLIFVMQPDDFKKSCLSLHKEIDYIEHKKIRSLEHKKKEKIVRNTTLFYLAIPTIFLSLLFVDFSGDENQEISLYKERITHLKQILKISKCTESKPIETVS